jgi:2,3-bisphosphoglycerate-dependent phosphoglycerate mutase/probable phosphoglycerate mutase
MRLIRAVLENTLPRYPEAIADNGEIWQVDYSEQGQKHAIKSLLFSEGRQHRA